MKKILNGNSVMMWVRISEGKLPGLLAIGAIAIGLTAVAGAYGAGYLKAIRSERKKAEADATKQDDEVIKPADDEVANAEVLTEDPVTEEDKGDMVKGVTNMFLHDHSFHAAVGATVGLAYLAFRLKYRPVNDWGQLCWRTNSFNLEASDRYCQGLMNLLRKCAAGASKYAESGNEEATYVLSTVGGDINDILNNVGSLRREDFGYRW